VKAIKTILWSVGFVMMILGVWQASNNIGLAVGLVVVGIAMFFTGLLLKRKSTKTEAKKGS
jgi:uncharacterized membrane protein